MAQVGRISGPLLTENLERNGIDLKFRNTLDDEVLLYLDVNSGKLGVDKSATAYELDNTNNVLKTTNLITPTSADIANYNISNNDINVLVGNIYLNASEGISLSNFETDNIHISDNSISSYRSNSNLELRPNGTGIVDVISNLRVNGNLHATENITADGSIIFGDQDTDDVTFNADVNSNIVPDGNNTRNLGAPGKAWNYLYTNSVNSREITAGGLNLDGILPFTNRSGNIIYVAENGNDANAGDHPQGPFKTIKRALEFADASTSGPVQILVGAGGYEEELPLVVPPNVNIVGSDMRNTIIRPTSADQSKDVFHLTGETTVQNLTIKDFYYDSGNDTGYAFRFAPNTVVTTRSPYVQNVTVITKGTTTSVDDPRGFDSGDAGKGALIDGADVLSASQEASMLFHSVTFITPGVDAVTMTNGVRVEWLNSFTYFANRGLYAVNGVTGHLSTDGSTIKYGAELRSIGSANVYGNYGAVADGADCIMYLIQHNLAYVGAGKYVDNDPTRAIQAQEVSELNSGRVYYQSIDHLGNFRVGNNFEINQETGETNLVLDEADIDSINGLTITTGSSTTIIDGTKVEVGNFRFSGNKIETLTGPINVSSASGTINFLKDTYMTQNLTMTGDLSFDGSLINLGNQTTDTISFNTEFTQNVLPDISGFYKLGLSNKTWKDIFLSQAQISDIKFEDNYITTSLSNADLDIRASGTGLIYVPSNNVTFSQNLTVNIDTDLQDVNVVGTVTQSGNRTQLGNYSLTNFTITDVLDVSSQAQFEEILFDGNVITTTSTNAELELRASGTGNVYVPLTDVDITNNLTVRDATTSTINVETTIDSVELIGSNDVNIRDNYIQTLQLNSDLEIRANGTSIIKTQNPVQINNNITVLGSMVFSGDLTGEDILSVNNLTAAKTFYAERFHTDDQIQIWDNNIATVVSNANLELKAAGTGGVYFEQTKFNENILSTDTLDLELISDTGNFELSINSAVKLPSGDDSQRILSLGSLRYNSTNNIFEGYGTSNIGFGGVYSDNMLTSVTVDPTANTIRMIVNGDDDPVDSSKLISEVAGDALYAAKISVDDISIDLNTISTTVSNSNLDLLTAGTGEIVIDDISFKNKTIKNNFAGIMNINNTGFGKVKFDNTYGIVVPYGSDAERPVAPPVGDTRWNTTSQILETWDGDTYIAAAGIAETISEADFNDILLEYTLALG